MHENHSQDCFQANGAVRIGGECWVPAAIRRAGPPIGQSARRMPGTKCYMLPLIGRLLTVAGYLAGLGPADSQARIARSGAAQPAARGDRICVQIGGARTSGRMSGASRSVLAACGCVGRSALWECRIWFSSCSRSLALPRRVRRGVGGPRWAPCHAVG